MECFKCYKHAFYVCLCRSIQSKSVELEITSNVTDMRSMFEETSSFNQPLEDWNVSDIIDTRDMFTNAEAFKLDNAPWYRE